MSTGLFSAISVVSLRELCVWLSLSSIITCGRFPTGCDVSTSRAIALNRTASHANLLSRRPPHLAATLPKLSPSRRNRSYAANDLPADPPLGHADSRYHPLQVDASLVRRPLLRPFRRRSLAHRRRDRNIRRLGRRSRSRRQSPRRSTTAAL